jgi:hypothetical protein
MTTDEQRCTRWPDKTISWSNIPDITDHFHGSAVCDAPLESLIAYIKAPERYDAEADCYVRDEVPVYASDVEPWSIPAVQRLMKDAGALTHFEDCGIDKAPHMDCDCPVGPVLAALTDLQPKETKDDMNDIKELLERKREIDSQLADIKALPCDGTNTPVSAEAIAVPGDHVVVCTDKRGVFFGCVESLDTLREECILTNVRNCIYWPNSQGGFGGLLSDGPHEAARIGAVIPRARINGLTFVGQVSPGGVAAWQSAPTHK